MDGSKKITGIVFAGIIMFAITACKVHPPGYISLYIDNLTSVNDTIDPGEVALNTVDNDMTDVINTRVTEEKLQKFQPLYNLETEVDFKQLIQNKTDTIVALRIQLNELQNSGIIKLDTVYEMKTVESPNTESLSHYMTQQLLSAKDEQIQLLQNQLNAMENAATIAPQPTLINKESSQVQPLISQQTDQFTLQLFQSQNDTIQFLRSQVRNLQLLPYKRDSVYIEKEAKVMQPAKELVFEQKTADLQALQDTLQLLKTRVLSLEEQTLRGKDTLALTRHEERDAPYKAKTDTTLIVAFYERGGIQPIDEEYVMKHIKELCNNKNVTKITLSGYTDSSGSEIVNKVITNSRLNFLSEMIISWIAKEKIFFQNFGDIYASDTMVSEERRIEIRMITK